tara:strand:- start:287 stop:1357 length:1071 start_codon:yes stop_codon:yes gene_type:complete
MKILVVMKRFGANKDMVMQDFGRQIRLFENLKQHKIDFLCPDYTKKENKDVKLHNMDFYMRAINIMNPFNFLKDFNQTLKKGKYDVIVATTTPIIGFISYFFSKKYKIKLLYDLQDNYEIYDAYKIPFFKYIDKYVTKKADAVICVSNILKDKVKKFRKKPIYIIENGVEINLFKSMPKLRARKILKLPIKSKIIVYIGHISNIKGFDILYDAFKIVKEKCQNTYLLLSGKIDKDIDLKKPNIIFKTFPKRKDVVAAINAADVAVLPNTENVFTKYCFPYKVLEYMACKVPIVATNIGDISKLLKNYEDSLCTPNSRSLADKIIKNFNKNKVNYNIIKKYNWKNLSRKLDSILRNI